MKFVLSIEESHLGTFSNKTKTYLDVAWNYYRGNPEDMGSSTMIKYERKYMKWRFIISHSSIFWILFPGWMIVVISSIYIYRSNDKKLLSLLIRKVAYQILRKILLSLNQICWIHLRKLSLYINTSLLLLWVAKEHIFPDIKIVYKPHKYAKVQNSIMCVFCLPRKLE